MSSEMNNIILLLSSGDSLSGGVGTYLQKIESVLSDNVVLVTGSSTGSVLKKYKSMKFIDGFNQMPSIRALISLLGYIYGLQKKNRVVVIANSTAGLLGSVFIKSFTSSAAVICVYHGLASKYKGFFAFLIEYISDKTSDISVFLNEYDLTRLRSKHGLIIPSYAERLSMVTADQSGEIICVARHTKQKNISVLLQAALQLSEYKINIYGTGELYQKHLNLISERLQNNVKLIQWAERSEMYDSKSILVLPTFSEGFPLAVMEAASAGIPLVLSDIPELKSIFGESALYFDNNNPNELVDIVKKLKQDASFYCLRSSASLLISDYYTEDKWVKLWNDCIDSLLFQKLSK